MISRTILTAILTYSFCISSAQKLTLKLPTAHTAWITTYEVSHNGKYIATGAYDNQIKLWDYNTKKEVHVFKGHKEPLNTLSFSPNDSILASGSTGGVIKIWDLRTGKCVNTIDTVFGMVNSLHFSPDGKLLAVSGIKSTIIIDLYKNVIKSQFGTANVKRVKFFPDSKKVAVAEADSSLSVWDIVDSAVYLEKESFFYKQGALNDFFFSPDGNFVYCALNGTTNNIRRHRVIRNSYGSLDSIRFTGHINPAKAICAGETEDIIYSLSEKKNPDYYFVDFEIKKWSISQRKCIDSSTFNSDRSSKINNIICYTNQNELVISNSGMIIFLNSKDLTNKERIQSKTSIVTGIFENDSSWISTSEDGVIRILDKYSASLKTLKSNGYFTGYTYYKNNSIITICRVIKATSSTYVLSYNLITGITDTLIKELNGLIRGAPGLIFKDDGSLLAYKVDMKDSIGETISRFKMWNMISKKQVKDIAANYISDVKFLPNNSFVLTTQMSNILFLHEDTSKIILQDTTNSKFQRYSHVEILDSLRIICSDNFGIDIWNVKTRNLEERIHTFYGSFGKTSNLIYLKLSADKQKLLLAANDTIKLLNLNTKKIEQTFSGDIESVTTMHFTNDGKSIVATGLDNSIKFWDIKTGRELHKIVFIDTTDYMIFSPKGYFKSSQSGAKAVHYATPNYKIINFEQLDIKYNRPDLVLQALGNSDTSLISSYRKAYEKRIKKLGIDTTVFREGFGLPQADFVDRDKIRFEQTDNKLRLHIKGKDAAYKLDRFNIWINEVPLFGLRGVSLRNKKSKSIDKPLTVTLSTGRNIIETSITNINGTESYRMPLLVTYTPAVKEKERTFFIGIGIDKFNDSKYNLKYSTKDIRDLSKKLKEKYADIIIDTLFNENVTISSVKALKQKLLQTTVNDKVLISYSGHGMLSKDFDYYLSTYPVNFDKPEENGLPYDELESLLDSIPARKKLMLIDACHSGEVDKDDLMAINSLDTLKIKRGLKPVAYKNQGHLGLKNSFELMQSLFVNVGKTTGATIISAAAGTQFALEGVDNLPNGVFTYCILEAMNKYPSMKISELKKIVGERVVEITKGLQKPTSRNETIAVDWNVW